VRGKGGDNVSRYRLAKIVGALSSLLIATSHLWFPIGGWNGIFVLI